jgi:hypothetical protein
MKKPRGEWTIDETWTNYQALKSNYERRIELHARLCLHYAPIAKYLAIRHLPLLEQDETPPLLIAVAWLELSRAIDEWSEPGEGTFRDELIVRVRDRLRDRVCEINV